MSWEELIEDLVTLADLTREIGRREWVTSEQAWAYKGLAGDIENDLNKAVQVVISKIKMHPDRDPEYWTKQVREWWRLQLPLIHKAHENLITHLRKIQAEARP